MAMKAAVHELVASIDCTLKDTRCAEDVKKKKGLVRQLPKNDKKKEGTWQAAPQLTVNNPTTTLSTKHASPPLRRNCHCCHCCRGGDKARWWRGTKGESWKEVRARESNLPGKKRRRTILVVSWSIKYFLLNHNSIKQLQNN
jgi:hypothetical protein